MPQVSCQSPVAYLLYASSLEEVIAPPEPPVLAPNDSEEKSQQQRKSTFMAMLMIMALRKGLNQYVTTKQKQQNC